MTSARAPKYQRIADALRSEIRNGTPPAGERMPAETDLVERFGVSLPTVRQALGVLRTEGVIESRQGIGTFVRDNRRLQRRSRNRYGRARDDKKLLTAHLRHEIISAQPEEPPQEISALLDEPTKRILVRRRRLINPDTNRPEELGASYLPGEYVFGTFLETTDVVPKALFLCIEDLSGKRYVRAEDKWQVRIASDDEVDRLELPTGTNVVHLTHVARAADDTVLEISESVWPADRVVILDEYDLNDEISARPSEV
ncbi:GntR family transcriptional regulator [Actinophytocola gossypii]|uniref:GntR family transcriptional regulator n=1 Tax=Actinophytocola gossypii TaxID=2812003 RepID=A0ABT2JIR8_9PSEU|nr:GntR family transcriptional regulator [Actinophytocola gossypii]MCT2587773.1 GntR family transcriptional regulator [Actinophytocola gossypii]